MYVENIFKKTSIWHNSDLSYDDYYSLRMALFDTRSMLKMCAEKLREIKQQIKKMLPRV